MLLLVVLGLALVPAVLINGVLWSEHFRGIAIFDPEIGGDPVWRARPVIVPLLVAVAAALRLVLARRRLPTRRWPARAYVLVLATAILAAAIAQIPEPSFSWY